tara:strand:+ start:422 stop:640 length:219 start_codon:yes stop_codon:yes gene_type:complete
MKRQEIINSMPEIDDFTTETEERLLEWLGGVIDHFEGVFSEIESLIDIQGVDDLGGIATARDLALKNKDDLY